MSNDCGAGNNLACLSIVICHFVNARFCSLSCVVKPVYNKRRSSVRRPDAVCIDAY